MSSNSEIEPKKLYFNRPQLNSVLIDANEEYHVLGRGTGKSSRILAYKALQNMLRMPRSVGIMMGETYSQLLTRTLPSFVAGLAEMGYQKDFHYFIGRKPNASFRFQNPYEPPIKTDYFLSFYNGSGMHLVSQDIVGSSNGINSDWIMADEVKYLDHQKYLDETLPTMRANRQRFSKLSCHHSICFTTSMPTTAESKWILAKREDMDPDLIDLLFQINLVLLDLEKELPKATKKRKAEIKREKKELTEELNVMRKTALYYQEASSLENIAILGEDYIRKMKRIMPDFIFKTEILNERPDSIEGGFYPLLDMDIHGYSQVADTSYLDGLNYDFERLQDVDCRMDGDCIKTVDLRISVDWGANISCMAICQYLTSINELRFINNLYVKNTVFDDLADKFIKYYAHHPIRVVHFCYDHTGNTRVPNSTLTYGQQFAKRLREAGWIVIMATKGAAPTHGEKYLLWYRLLKRESLRLPAIRFNRYKCKELITSMKLAPVKDGNKGIEKDKTSERNKNIDQEDATHFSDTADIQVVSLFTNVINGMPDFMGNLSA